MFFNGPSARLKLGGLQGLQQRNLKPHTQNPKSQNPKPKAQDQKSQTPSPISKTQNPKPKAENPKSRTQKSNSKTQKPKSKAQIWVSVWWGGVAGCPGAPWDMFPGFCPGNTPCQGVLVCEGPLPDKCAGGGPPGQRSPRALNLK